MTMLDKLWDRIEPYLCIAIVAVWVGLLYGQIRLAMWQHEIIADMQSAVEEYGHIDSPAP